MFDVLHSFAGSSRASGPRVRGEFMSRLREDRPFGLRPNGLSSLGVCGGGCCSMFCSCLFCSCFSFFFYFKNCFYPTWNRTFPLPCYCPFSNPATLSTALQLLTTPMPLPSLSCRLLEGRSFHTSWDLLRRHRWRILYWSFVMYLFFCLELSDIGTVRKEVFEIFMFT